MALGGGKVGQIDIPWFLSTHGDGHFLGTDEVARAGTAQDARGLNIEAFGEPLTSVERLPTPRAFQL